MKKFYLLIPVLLAGLLIFSGQKSPDSNENNSVKWNKDSRMTRIIQEGEYAPLPQSDNVIFSTFDRNIITPNGVLAVSPNFRVHPSAGTQSEVPITRHPTNQLIMLGSANTYRGGSDFSTGVYVTTDGGVTWFGSDTLNNGGFNYGDPGPMIDRNGVFLMSYITLTGSMGASYSTNNGINWAPTVTFPGASTSADKNLSGTDDAPSSPYYGRSYTVYTEFAGSYTDRIVSTYTTNGGVSWSTISPVSTVPSSGHHHQGCEVCVGPTGQVYVVWANCASNGQNSTEDSLGFAKSTDGGVTWTTTVNNADNMNGIRADEFSFFNGIRVNGFPRIDVDKTGGARNGWIYVVSSEKTVDPATDVSDVILHRSTNGGVNWTSSRVNQDTPGNGKRQYMAAVRVDEYGGVNVVYYDTRNIPTNDSAQIYVSRSVDGGNTWTDILVSDHKFKPKPISGLAGGYQGDYIGITSGNGKIWPYWAEDITGSYQAWTSSIDIGPAILHTALPNTEQLAGSYAVNCVITPSGSNINPAKTKLYYSRNNPVITDSILMTNSSGTNWTANIPATGSAATYRYYIKTEDLLNRAATSPSGAPAVLNTFSASTDNTNPVITHTPLENQSKPYWPSTVSATVTDNLGLDSVWVKWYKNSPVTTKQFKLVSGGGSSFSAAFNSLNSDVVLGDVISYKIFAKDNSLAHNTDSTTLYSFTIIELQLCEGFSGTTFPPQFWNLEYTGTAYWTRDAVTSYGIGGSGSAKFDFWSATSGTIQSLVTLAFQSSVPGDSLKFHNAYAPYSSGTDSLIIETSTNAGTTFSTLVRLYGNASGGSLNTAPTSTIVFTPTSSQWAVKNYSLPVGTNMVKFRANSGYGNNLYLDSICKVQGIPPPPPPVITSSADSIVVNLPLGSDSTSRNLSIGNTGGSVLNWSLTEASAVFFANVKAKQSFTDEQIKEIISQPKGAKDIYQGEDVTDAAGGPDAFGYIWTDSDEPGGPAFNWVDISGTGTPITAWTSGTGDDGSVIVSLPSAFPYYGSNYSQLKICTNGWVSFDVASTSNAFSNTPIPDVTDPNNALYGFWDDLDVRTAGNVYYYNDVANSRFIVEYKDVPHYSTGQLYTFEIILYNDGRIYYQYLSMNTLLNSCTIGNENNLGSDGLQVVYNANYLHNNLAIKIEKGGLPWVDENPSSGSVAISGSQNVDVKFKSTGLSAGTYTGKLKISSNDPVNPVKEVKVRLNVGLAVPSTITIAVQGFYNIQTNKLNLKDYVKVNLRNTFPPYSIVDSAVSLIDSVTFTGSYLFSNAPSGTYYLQVLSRNSLETWSKAGGQVYVSGTPFSYNFTTSATQAYNSNMILVSGKFCNISGDVNQDRIVDASDISLVENAVLNGSTGYIPEDLTGDYFVDAEDLSIAENNSGIYSETPPGAVPAPEKILMKKNKIPVLKEAGSNR